jgi:hypothetical protein
MRRPKVVPAAAAVIAATAAAGFGVLSTPHLTLADTEDFTLDWQTVSVDDASQTATFTLSFNRVPDFSAPPGGSQPDAFLYEIDADASTFNDALDFDDIDTVIRGAEIHKGEGIPVRDRDGDGGPDAGGWGPVRALLPFDLDGQTLTFTTGLSDIGDDDSRFRYRLITIDGGALTGETQGAVIPLPTALWGGVVMLSALGAARVLRKAQP